MTAKTCNTDHQINR